MSSSRILSVLAVAALLVGCHDQPAGPSNALEPEFKKGGTPGSPDAPQYEFVYPVEGVDLGSDCLHQADLGFGRQFYCDDQVDPPTFKLQIVRVNADGTRQEVDGGTVTFWRCENLRGDPLDWTYCGTNKRGYKKYFQQVYYGEDSELSGGLAELTLSDFWAEDCPVWGMHWEYDEGDGNKPEASVKWRDLAFPGYTYPLDPEVCPG